MAPGHVASQSAQTLRSLRSDALQVRRRYSPCASTARSLERQRRCHRTHCRRGPRQLEETVRNRPERTVANSSCAPQGGGSRTARGRVHACARAGLPTTHRRAAAGLQEWSRAALGRGASRPDDRRCRSQARTSPPEWRARVSDVAGIKHHAHPPADGLWRKVGAELRAHHPAVAVRPTDLAPDHTELRAIHLALCLIHVRNPAHARGRVGG